MVVGSFLACGQRFVGKAFAPRLSVKPVPLGTYGTWQGIPGPQQTAEALGNPGVKVIGSPALLALIEGCSNTTLQPFYEAEEAAVGIRFALDHCSAAVVGEPLQVQVKVVEVTGRRVQFKVEILQQGRLVMHGSYTCQVVDLPRFLARYGLKAGD
ncbi:MULTISPECIES: thioesterase family protein [unclassified Synechococcus]|uniref:thioesterase family protein n=1 Tax=unclassified Synechococcus TaxID=2626047 RepID=UPI0039C40360